MADIPHAADGCPVINAKQSIQISDCTDLNIPQTPAASVCPAGCGPPDMP
tara:strand:+ start:223 stop:372 length:150 start_codon:yes stop_codon:yes gene_type:complete